MKKPLTGILLFFSIITYAQVNNPWTQYYQAPYLQNPALSGIEHYTDIKLGFKRQWATFDGAPRDYFLGINHTFEKTTLPSADSLNNDSETEKPKRRMGISGYVAGSNYNLIDDLQTGVAYAVHIPLSQQYYLSFGIAATYRNSKADTEELVVRDKEDPVYLDLIQAGGRLNYFNMDAGMFLYSDHLYAGYTAVRLVRVRLGNDLSGNGKSSVRHTALLGYRYEVNSDWEVQPAVLFRMEDGLDNYYNFNVRTRYRKIVWAGIGYSPDISLSLLTGYQFKNHITLSYNYDFNIGTLNKGSHEIILGIMPFNKSGIRTSFW